MGANANLKQLLTTPMDRNRLTSDAWRMDGGALIRELRKALGLTQQQVGDHFGITDSAVGQWELGKTNPTWTQLPRLDQVLHAHGDVMRAYGMNPAGPSQAPSEEDMLVLRAAFDRILLADQEVKDGASGTSVLRDAYRQWQQLVEQLSAEGVRAPSLDEMIDDIKVEVESERDEPRPTPEPSVVQPKGTVRAAVEAKEREEAEARRRIDLPGRVDAIEARLSQLEAPDDAVTQLRAGMAALRTEVARIEGQLAQLKGETGRPPDDPPPNRAAS